MFSLKNKANIEYDQVLKLIKEIESTLPQSDSEKFKIVNLAQHRLEMHIDAHRLSLPDCSTVLPF